MKILIISRAPIWVIFQNSVTYRVRFCAISQWLLFGFLSNHKKALLRWLLHLHNNLQLIPSRGLPCGHDRSSTFFYANNQSYNVNVHWIPTKLGTEIHCIEPFNPLRTAVIILHPNISLCEAIIIIFPLIYDSFDIQCQYIT